MEFTDKAIIFKATKFRENDIWLRLFTPTRGVLTAFAFGGCRSRRRFCGCLDAMSEVLFRFKTSTSGTYLQLQEGTLLRRFQTLRDDWRRLGAAANCLRFLESAHKGADGASDAYDLLIHTLGQLDRGEPGFEVLPVYFRATLTFGQGLEPDFLACQACRKDLDHIGSAHFVIPRGAVLCEHCRTGAEGGLPVSRGGLKTLDHLVRLGPDGWKRLGMSDEVRRECFTIVERFIEYHLDIGHDSPLAER